MPKINPLKAQSTLVVKLRPWVPAIYKAQIGSIRCRIPAPVFKISVSWVVKFISERFCLALKSVQRVKHCFA